MSTPEIANSPQSSPAATSYAVLRWLTRLRQPRAWLFVFPAAVAVYLAGIAWCWPFTERNLLDVLQQRSSRSVTIGRFTQTYFPPGCMAEDIKFLRYRDKSKPPLITIQKLTIEDYYALLLTLQHRLSRVSVVGLHMAIPSEEPQGEPSPTMLLTHSPSGKDMPVQSITADNSLVDFLPKESGAQLMRLTIRKLQLDDVSSNKPLTYHVLLSTSALPGEISSNGRWGPWDPKKPGETPVQGTYSFHNGDLSHLEYFAGLLDSTGQFQGKLSAIRASGSIHATEFKVGHAAHKRNVSVRYNAIVDGKNGDVALPYTFAQFDHTLLYAKGSIRGVTGVTGKALDFDLYSSQARAEDLLRLFISDPNSPFSGQISMAAHAFVPPGHETFVRRLQFDGNFGITSSEFRNPNLDRELARLSTSAVKGDKAEDREDPQSVLSDLSGRVTSRAGVAHMQDISFKMPGASAKVAGTYTLTTYQTDLSGTLLTTGNLSDATSGFKSVLIKALTPFFKKHGNLKSVPFRISGPYGKVAISLNWPGKRK